MLHRHVKDPDYIPEFGHRSIISKLNYLERCTRCDMSHATHQCSRFSSAPKEPHIEAIRWFIRCLKGTRDKGLIWNPSSPTQGLDIKCYVDSDFAGLWNCEDIDDPHCTRSRTGYIITVNNCPVIWKSKLQSLNTLSTMESEYESV